MQTTFKQQLVNDAYNTTLTTLRRARDQAAADMRVYVVTFAGPTAGNGGTITVTQTTPAGTVLMTSYLPPQVTFHLEPGLPNTVATTPDGFGTAASIFDFDQPPSAAGGGTVIYFQPDGSAQDAARQCQQRRGLPGNSGATTNLPGHYFVGLYGPHPGMDNWSASAEYGVGCNHD